MLFYTSRPLFPFALISINVIFLGQADDVANSTLYSRPHGLYTTRQQTTRMHDITSSVILFRSRTPLGLDAHNFLTYVYSLLRELKYTITDVYRNITEP